MQLSLLLELKQITRHFAVNLYGAIDASLQGKLDNQKLLALAQAIYAPYVPYIVRYNVYETAQLEHQLRSMDFAQDDLSETINSLSLSISRIMEYANEANKRCKLFTDGCGYPGLLKSLNVCSLKKFDFSMKNHIFMKFIITLFFFYFYRVILKNILKSIKQLYGN